MGLNGFNDLEVVIPLGDETSLNITQQNQLESIKNFTKYSEHVFTIVESENDNNQLAGVYCSILII